jgi:hypothetical protein
VKQDPGACLEPELSPIPTASASGAKRKRPAASPPTTHQQAQVVHEGLSSPVVSLGHLTRPAHVVEKPGDSRAFSAAGSHVPPAEYKFNVPAADHDLIARGAKTLEIRCVAVCAGDRRNCDHDGLTRRFVPSTVASAGST